MTVDLVIKRGLLFFWGAYFTIVLASNVTDGLKAMAVVPDTLRFMSGNYALVERVTSIYAVPPAGLEATHVALLSAQLLSLLVYNAKLSRRARAPVTGE